MSWLLIFIAQIINCGHIIYPVTSTENKTNNFIYTLYQKRSYEREIWCVNIEDQEASKTILSSFIPTYISMLPNNKGISFIDRGRLRVKYFHKRSPKSIIFEDPLHDFDSVEWLTDKDCFFSARRYSKHVILFCDINDQQLHVIEEDILGDTFCPQKVDDKLFCILKTGEYFSIIKSDFINPSIVQEDKPIVYEEEDRKIVDFGKRPIIFLNMVNQEKGYVVELLKNEDQQCSIVSFAYHSIAKINKNWFIEKLFDFSLDLEVLMISEIHFSNMLKPFMPHHCADKIYFSSLKENQTMNIFEYDQKSKETVQKTFKVNGDHVFAPYVFNNKVYYGKKLTSQEKLWVEDDGDISRIIPHLIKERVSCN